MGQDKGDKEIIHLLDHSSNVLMAGSGSGKARKFIQPPIWVAESKTVGASSTTFPGREH